MTVRIEIFGENAVEALNELHRFAGGFQVQGAPTPKLETSLGTPAAPQYKMRTDTISAAPYTAKAEATDEPVMSFVTNGPVTETATETAAAEAPKRERGKPSPGRARRTKEEIAEDEAADKADAANAEPAEPQPNITAEPENRVDPASEAEAEQDAEDEAADEANAPAPEATRDDVRAAMLAYQGAYGTPALMADMTAILNEEYPAGGVTKLSEIPDTPADFAKITARLNDALTNNTFSREKV